MVNFYCFYCVDEDFGPFLIKFCSYFPYTAKLCLNGHEYLKRQLQKRAIAFEALDYRLLRCEQIERAQHIAEGLSVREIRGLPSQMTAQAAAPLCRLAGYRYELSVLQAEFSLT